MTYFPRVDLVMPLQHPQQPQQTLRSLNVWIVIPMFRVRSKIESVLRKIPDWVAGVVAVDDKCPENSGDFVEQLAISRVIVVRHTQNQGVGGAVLTGYRAAISQGARIISKVDGDDQMDLRMLATLIIPVAAGQADYAKGNRFSTLSHTRSMPALRLFGNSILSLMSKMSSGYWNIFDPTNGYTAIDARVAKEIVARNVSKRYFFESDMLYHLGTLRAVVIDVPMPAVYGDEKSNLSVVKIIVPFLIAHARNAMKRFVGQYIVRDFTVATIEFLAGLALLIFGGVVSINYFLTRTPVQDVASPGMVMLAALPIILGFQLLLQAINFDVMNVPSRAIHPTLRAIDDYTSLDHVDNKAAGTG